jgi:hypothetical protein
MAFAAILLALAGCSNGGGVTTASVLSKDGGGEPIQPKNDPTSRAFQVATVSARAVKCGYNFDPAKLRSNFLAAEATQPDAAANMANIEKTYDVTYNGITKAVAQQGDDYCSEKKTAEIKNDLSRHLAGDYTPSPRKVAAAPADQGLFSGFFDGGLEPENGPKFGSQDWWDKQSDKVN